MSIEPNTLLNAELALQTEARRTKLLEKARGRGLLSWLDLAFLLPVVLFGYLAWSGSAKLQRETLAMFAALIMVVQWSVVRLSMRLNALVQYLLDQQARQDVSADAATPARPPA